MTQSTAPLATCFVLDAVICTIAGQVRRVSQANLLLPEPVAQATVQIKDQATFRETETNAQGQFKFKNLRPGPYTLIVKGKEGGQSERQICVPPNYDVVLAAPAAPPPPPPGGPPAAPSTEEPSPAVVQVTTQAEAAKPAKTGQTRRTRSTTG